MNIIQSTTAYESALRKATIVDDRGLLMKHDAMAADAFSHLRATYYRWVERFGECCGKLSESGPRILAVGDLHVQNFGTWRDGEGRLVWGIDDFDEADEGVSFASDLVRLAVSAVLSKDVKLSTDTICENLLSGYEAGLASGSEPFVLDEKHEWLRDLARTALKSPEKFWRKWLEDKTVEIANAEVDPSAIEAFAESYPEGAVPETFRVTNPEKPKGLGSLGRKRYFAYNPDWRGGPVAREAKAAVPPATRIGESAFVSFVGEIQKKAVRSPDPVYRLHGRWVCKAILATTGRIEMEDLAVGVDQAKLLRAMGQETANVHRGSCEDPEDLLKALDSLKTGIFGEAVAAMTVATEKDWQEWKDFSGRSVDSVLTQQ